MAGLEDTLRKAVPGGNIGKPLMLAFIALLASGALFGKRDAGRSAGTGAQPTSDQGTGGLLGGLGGLLDKWQKGGLGNAINSWIGTGQNRLTWSAGLRARHRRHQDAGAALRPV